MKETTKIVLLMVGFWVVTVLVAIFLLHTAAKPEYKESSIKSIIKQTTGIVLND